MLGLPLFLVGFGVSWLVFRLGNGWWALILVVAFGLVHLSYATVDSIGPFLWSIFLGILLVANLGLHRRRAAWQAIGVSVQADALGWTLASATMLAAWRCFWRRASRMMRLILGWPRATSSSSRPGKVSSVGSTDWSDGPAARLGPAKDLPSPHP